jgi:hypothetical protein
MMNLYLDSELSYSKSMQDALFASDLFAHVYGQNPYINVPNNHFGRSMMALYDLKEKKDYAFKYETNHVHDMFNTSSSKSTSAR